VDQVEVAGLRVAYERVGQGPPLVLLHGFVGDGAGTWRRQLDALSDEFTVVAWDGPGTGRSSDPPESFRISDFADCLAGFVDALGLESPHVAGLSFGGILALELSRLRPALPRTLVLAGAYAGWAGSFPPDVVADRLRLCLHLAELPTDQLVASMVPTMFSDSVPAATVEEFAASMGGVRRGGFRTMSYACAEADLRDVLGRIQVPTLLLYGDADVRAPLTVAEALHAAIRGSRLVVLPGVGHVSPVEAPERFNDEVRAFLREAQR
jgi:pimeloyl-ACP methyl ester carboxylesterase